MNKGYPEFILIKLRQREGLGPFDRALDKKLNSLEPKEAFSEVLRWEGIIGYETFIIEWLRNCGFEVTLKK